MIDVKMNFDPDDLENIVLQEGLAAAKERAASMQCKVHGEAPVLKLEGAQVTISACCDEFAEQVAEAVSD